MSDTRLREQRYWYLYDWANSAFASTVVTLFLGPYLTELAKGAADASGYIHPFGLKIEPRSWWGYLVSLSVLTQVIVLPVLGAVADYSHNKKFLLGTLATIGASATLLMFTLTDGHYLWGGLLFLVANLAFGASIVIYNAFLPEIATEQERDSVSSKGWGIGYLGGGIVLLANLLLFQNAQKLGLSESLAVRISLGSAGVWWMLFTFVALTGLRNRQPVRKLEHGQSVWNVGFGGIFKTLREMRRFPQTLTFLVAYLIYNDAIQAVITLSGQFAADELKMPMSQLTMAILMVQFVAFVGALVFNQIAKWLTAKGAVLVSLVIWTGVIVAMYSAVRSATGFFIAAAVVAIVMGGSQALSRSLFSLMIPPGKEAEYFSLYEISDKGTSWLAPLIFGLALQFTQSYRVAILSLIVFFLAGLLVLSRVDVARATREAASSGAPTPREAL